MSKSDQQRHGMRAAALHIRQLLARSARYRTLWEAKAEKLNSDEVNQPAVCRVLAEYLWEEGLEPDTRKDLPRVLKDSVSRAFSGKALSPKLLRTFIAAFEFTEKDADNAWALYRGEAHPTVIIGTLPPPDEMAKYRVPKFEIIKLQEHHWLGPTGLPARHRTEINIRSSIDGLDSYQYRIDTPHGKIRAIRGGRQSDLYEISNGIWAVDLTFPHKLHRDEIHYMEFWTLLTYDRPPSRELRRGVHGRIEQMDLRVEFHPHRLPSAVYWAEWGHYRGPGNRIINRQLVALDEELAVHRYLEAVERAVVGFSWEW